MKSCIYKSIFGLFGVIFLFSGVMAFISWRNNEEVLGIHGNGLLIYIAISIILGLVGVSGAFTNWDR
jgi:hypothetical protein